MRWFRCAKTLPPMRDDGYVPQPDDAELAAMIRNFRVADAPHVNRYPSVWFKHPYDVEEGVTADKRNWMRGMCPCGWHGEWHEVTAQGGEALAKDWCKRDAEGHPMDMAWNLGDWIYDD